MSERKRERERRRKNNRERVVEDKRVSKQCGRALVLAQVLLINRNKAGISKRERENARESEGKRHSEKTK